MNRSGSTMRYSSSSSTSSIVLKKVNDSESSAEKNYASFRLPYRLAVSTFTPEMRNKLLTYPIKKLFQQHDALFRNHNFTQMHVVKVYFLILRRSTHLDNAKHRRIILT